jgi:hypothetical protein
MQKFLILLSLAMLAACSTPAKVTSLKELSKSNGLKSGILLTTHLDPGGVVSADSGCVLTLTHAGEMKPYTIDIKVGKSTVLADLPEGTFAYQKLNCGSSKWTLWEYAPFQIFAGKISLLGDIGITLTNAKRVNFHSNDREKNRLDAIDLFINLPKENKSPVVSGYTGQEIDSTKLERPARYKKWDYLDGNAMPIKNSEKDWPSFKVCYEPERKINALWLGNLVMDASYDQGHQEELKVREGWNTFTPAFRDCAKSVMEKFVPKAHSQVRYVIYL